ncbi:MAG: glycosyltransferase [Chitinophagaceae bacterium]
MSARIHIVHIINNLSLGGAENLLRNLLPGLQEKGFQISLICLNGMAHPGIRANIEAAGIPIHVLGQGSVYRPGLILKLYRLLRQLNPDIVHAHLFPSTYWAAMAIRLEGRKRRLIMTEHSTSNKRMKQGALKWIERWNYHTYHTVICISNGVQQRLAQYVPTVNTVMIPNGIPMANYTQANPTPPDAETRQAFHRFFQPEQHFLILSVGRLIPSKNHETAIRAMKHLPQSMRLMICGDGVQKEKLQQLIVAEQVQDRVWLAGKQEAIPYFIQQAQVGLLCSHFEGFGLAAVEMMAGGLPVICSKVEGLQEICADPFLLVAPTDAESIAQKIVALQQDKDLYVRMKTACLEKAPQYSMDAMCSGYAQFYHSLCRP